MPYFLLLYDVVENYAEARKTYRPAHLAMAQSEHESGRLLLAGAFGEPPHGAAFIFRTDDRGHVEDFARRDPYVINGVVTNWRVEPWNVVIGGEMP